MASETRTKTTPLHVLILDDNRDAAQLLAVLLEMRGYTTDVAFSPADAEQSARSHRPDVAFVDLEMSGPDGYSFARMIRSDANLSSVRLVALTCHDSAEDRARTKAAGFDAHLAKPADLRSLEAALTSEGMTPAGGMPTARRSRG